MTQIEMTCNSNGEFWQMSSEIKLETTESDTRNRGHSSNYTDRIETSNKEQILIAGLYGSPGIEENDCLSKKDLEHTGGYGSKLAESSGDVKNNHSEVPLNADVKIEHGEIGEFSCEICDERFLDGSIYTNHIKSHICKKNRCDECGLEFSTNRKLKAHLYSTHSKTDSSLSMNINYRSPISSKVRSRKLWKRFQCKKCSKDFSQKIKYLIHLKSHDSKLRCSKCNLNFKTKKEKYRHMLQHKTSLVCKKCGQYFPVEEVDNYCKHIREHYENRFTCKQCGKGFSALSKLEMHNASHTGYKPKTFKCRQCGRGFWNKMLLRRHQAIHGVNHELYTCNICGKEIFSKSRLTAHQVCHRPKSHPCSFCGKLFLLKCHVRVHERKHTGEKPYYCDICGAQFGTYARHRRHMDIHKGNVKACPFCTQVFTLKTNLCRHLAIHARKLALMKLNSAQVDCNLSHLRHQSVLVIGRPTMNTCDKITDNPSQGKSESQSESDTTIECQLDIATALHCEICNEMFKTKMHLKAHSLIHAIFIAKQKSNCESFVCDQCGRIYKSKYNLESHRTRHFGRQPFGCDEPGCDESYPNKTLLNRHLLAAHGKLKERPYIPCEYCGKTFDVKCKLREHIKIHTGERPYPCSVCNKRFRQRPHLNTHMRTHTGERPFECALCGKAFAAHSTLRNHIRNIHNDANKQHATNNYPATQQVTLNYKT